MRLLVQELFSDDSSFNLRDNLLGPAFNVTQRKAWHLKRAPLQNEEPLHLIKLKLPKKRSFKKI